MEAASSHTAEHHAAPFRTTDRASLNPTPGLIMGKTILQEDTCTPARTAAVSTIATEWKEPAVHPQVNGHRDGLQMCQGAVTQS